MNRRIIVNTGDCAGTDGVAGGGFGAGRAYYRIRPPAGQLTINRYSRLELGPGQIRVRYVIDMARSTFQERAKMDLNRDGAIRNTERMSIFKTKSPFCSAIYI
jgi:hypothetical protein